GAIDVADSVRRERVLAIGKRAVEIAGVGGEIADAVAAAEHGAGAELVAEADARAEVPEMRIPKMPVVTADTGECVGAGRAVGIFGAEIERAQPVEAVCWGRLEIPA